MSALTPKAHIGAALQMIRLRPEAEIEDDFCSAPRFRKIGSRQEGAAINDQA